MKIEDHLRNINESLEVIKESIERGLQERQRNIAFNVSVASTEMLEVYLHKLNLISLGTILKHDWFGSIRKANEKLPFEFEDKDKFISILNEVESKRNNLCYGKLKPVEEIQGILENFNQIKKLLEVKGLKWN